MLQFTQFYILYLVHIGIVSGWPMLHALSMFHAAEKKNILEQKYVFKLKTGLSFKFQISATHPYIEYAYLESRVYSSFWQWLRYGS